MKYVLYKKENLQVMTRYEAESQISFGGDWGVQEFYETLIVPNELDLNCVELQLVNNVITPYESEALIQIRRNNKLDQLRSLREPKLKEVDLMINELVLGLRSDNQAIIDYRGFLLSFTDSYKNLDGSANSTIETLDFNNISWPVKP